MSDISDIPEEDWASWVEDDADLRCYSEALQRGPLAAPCPEISILENPDEDVAKQALAIVVERLAHRSGLQYSGQQELLEVDYEVETLLVASKHGRIIGGATLARCPRGVVVKEVGALQGLGGGTALLAGAASFARRTDDSDAAQFWGRGGFYRLHWGWFAYNRCPERHSELAARLHHEAAGRLTEEEWVAELRRRGGRMALQLGAVARAEEDKALEEAMRQGTIEDLRKALHKHRPR